MFCLFIFSFKASGSLFITPFLSLCLLSKSIFSLFCEEGFFFPPCGVGCCWKLKGFRKWMKRTSTSQLFQPPISLYGQLMMRPNYPSSIHLCPCKPKGHNWESRHWWAFEECKFKLFPSLFVYLNSTITFLHRIGKENKKKKADSMEPGNCNSYLWFSYMCLVLIRLYSFWLNLNLLSTS